MVESGGEGAMERLGGGGVYSSDRRGHLTDGPVRTLICLHSNRWLNISPLTTIFRKASAGAVALWATG